jgi:hypothetical protein
MKSSSPSFDTLNALKHTYLLYLSFAITSSFTLVFAYPSTVSLSFLYSPDSYSSRSFYSFYNFVLPHLTRRISLIGIPEDDALLHGVVYYS